MEKLTMMIEEWTKRRPYLEETGNLYLTINKKLKEINAKIKDFDLDEAKDFFEGIPLLKSSSFNMVDKKAVVKILKDLVKIKASEINSVPLRKQLDNLSIYLKNKSSKDIEYLIDEIIRSKDNNILSLKDNKELQLLNLFVWYTLAYCLSAYKEKIDRWIKEKGWIREYCPTCGHLPSMAKLVYGKRGRSRYLSCGHCNTEWSYSRIGCPYCGDMDQNKLHILEVDKEPNIRIDICDSCSSYIKTYIGEDDPSINLIDIMSIHIDLLCKDKGYEKYGNLLDIR